MYKHLLISLAENGILTITINRESKLNALNIELLGEINEALHLHHNDTRCKGVIITGMGTKAFAAGADIAEFSSFTLEQGTQLAERGHEIFKAIETYPKPVIAAVNGFALGGGCELSMACHIRVASPNAKFGQPEVNLGIIPGYGGTQRLVQLIGKGKAIELLMTADFIGAEEALRLGLVNYVVPQEDLINKCSEIIQKIASKSPVAIAKIIEAVDAYFTDGQNGLAEEVRLFGECFATHDFKEGTQAFLEKRKAQFTGN